MLLSYRKLFEKKNPNIGDLVVCIGNIDDLKTHNHVGVLKPSGVEFINRFSDKLHDLGGECHNRNGWFIRDPNWVKPFENNKKGNNIPLFFSEKFRDVVSYSLRFLVDYERIFYCDISYIDITLRNDTVSFLRAEDYYKLEKNENPWKSTMRQNIRFGRFIKKVVDEPDKIIEDYTNEYKFSYKLNKEESGHFKKAKGIDMAKW